MPVKLTQETKLAGFLLLAAISPTVSWYMLLFVAKPSNVSVAAAAWSELSYVFSRENAVLELKGGAAAAGPKRRAAD